MKTTWARRVCSHPALCGSSHAHLARDFPDQISAPPRKPAKDAPSEQVAAYEQTRTALR